MGDYAQRLYHVIKQNRLHDRYPELQGILRRIERDKLPESVARAYLLRVEGLLDDLHLHPNVLVRAPTIEEINQDGSPDVVLGRLTENDVPFGLRISDRPRHVLVAGATGSGKSTTSRRIVLGIDAYARDKAAVVSQVILDKKSDFTDVPAACGSHWMHLDVDEGMRLGLNAPRGCDPHKWVNVISTILAARMGLIASSVVLANIIRFLLSVLNPTPTAKLLWPDFRLILDVLRTTSLNCWASKADYGKTLINAVQGIVDQSGVLLQTFNGFDVLRDVIDKGKSVVINMEGLAPPALRLMVVDIILAQIFFTRLYTHHKVDTTEIVLVIDEADQDVSRASDFAYPDGLSMAGEILKKGREFGIMAVIAVTVMGGVSRYVLSGAQYHFLFNMSDAESIQEAQRTLLLPQGGGLMFPALVPGECIFRASQSSWSHPMLCKVDYLAPCRTPKQTGYDTHPFVESKPLDELPDVKAALPKKKAPPKVGGKREVEDEKSGVSDGARALLFQACMNPCVPVSQLWKRMAKVPRPATRTAIREELEASKLADFVKPRLGRRNPLLIDPTDAGWRLAGFAPPKRIGRGGLVHRHVAHWIRMVGEHRGCDSSRIEWVVPGTGHPVDVAWKMEKGWAVFEIVIDCKENLGSHVRTCFVQGSGVTTLTVVAAQVKLLKKLKAKIDGDDSLAPVRDRISFEPVETYLREAFS